MCPFLWLYTEYLLSRGRVNTFQRRVFQEVKPMKKASLDPPYPLNSRYYDLLSLPLRIAFYHRIPAQEDNSLILLESARVRQWIHTIPHWDLCALFFDTKPGWVGYHKLCASSFDLILARNMSVFGDRPSEIYRKVRKLPKPVLFESEKILSSSEDFFDWYRRSQESDEKVMIRLKGGREKYA